MLALCLLALVGCGGTNGRTVQNDPLLGSGHFPDFFVTQLMVFFFY